MASAMSASDTNSNRVPLLPRNEPPRPTNIINLPDEILLRIISQIFGLNDSPFITVAQGAWTGLYLDIRGRRSVIYLALTCRRFYHLIAGTSYKPRLRDFMNIFSPRDHIEFLDGLEPGIQGQGFTRCVYCRSKFVKDRKCRERKTWSEWLSGSWITKRVKKKGSVLALKLCKECTRQTNWYWSYK